MLSRIIFGVAALCLLVGIILIASADGIEEIEDIWDGAALVLIGLYLLPTGGLAVQISRLDAKVETLLKDAGHDSNANEPQQPTGTAPTASSRASRPIGTQPRKE